jgi:nucleoid-associated protein YejK
MILHEIGKAQGDTKSTFRASTQELPSDILAENLIEELHKTISDSPKKVYGRFYAVGASYFKTELDAHLLGNAKTTLLKATEKLFGDQTDGTLRTYLTKEPLSTGGHVIAAEYTVEKRRYFVVAMINNKKGRAIEISSSGVPRLINTQQIDFDLMDLACRIDIGEYLRAGNPGNYLCFFTTHQKISNYFIEFIGCQHFNQAKDNTVKLVNLIDLAVKGLPNDDDLRSTAYSYCHQRIQNKDVVVVDDLSEHLFGTPRRKALLAVATTNNIDIDNSFSVTSTEIRRLVSFKYKGDWIDSLRFDKKHLTKTRIQTSVDGTSVTLNDVPDLVKRIKHDRA